MINWKLIWPHAPKVQSMQSMQPFVLACPPGIASHWSVQLPTHKAVHVIQYKEQHQQLQQRPAAAAGSSRSCSSHSSCSSSKHLLRRWPRATCRNYRCKLRFDWSRVSRVLWLALTLSNCTINALCISFALHPLCMTARFVRFIIHA